MKIGIIGSGNIGGTLARLFVRDGHEVAISNSRGPDTLADMVRELGSNARAATVAEAAAWGDIVIEAIPFGRYRDLPVQEVMGKIFISASNYYPQRDGEIARDGRATAELVAEHLAGARVVKAFNTIQANHLAQQGDTAKAMDDRRVLPISGDDPDAKQEVAALITALGFAPLDMGSLHDSTQQEPNAPIYNNDVTLKEARELRGR